MVIWQVGTNAAWKGYDLDEVASAIQDGLAQLRKSAADADIVLMDLQYTTAMIDPATIAYSNDMVARIDGIAKNSKVNLFRRFALMRFWSVVWGISIGAMTEPGDKYLHQSDWSYNQVAKILDQVVWERLQRDGVTIV